MLKLVYHKIESDKSESIFDFEITNLIKGCNVSIVCPYMSISYLKRLLSISKEWKLITDITEWLNSNNKQNQLEILTFIEENNHKIHHLTQIHSKVITTDSKAFFGSANFTNSGITKRIEMSALIEDQTQVNELNDWFNNLWENTDAINPEGLQKLKQEVNLIESRVKLPKYFQIDCKFHMKEKQLVSLNHIPQYNNENVQYWFANIDAKNSNVRIWEDLLKYGFWGVDEREPLTKRIHKIKKGDTIFCYRSKLPSSNNGYIGYGEVISEKPILAKDFIVKSENKTLEELYNLGKLKSKPIGGILDDEKLGHYVIAIHWIKNYDIAKLRGKMGLFSSRHSLCKLKAEDVKPICQYFEINQYAIIDKEE